ncbi:CoA transferase [Altererythrobacter sp.]|uniref:CoA transferase n=1 Tax=Altererythrobacter sp. TaxID=1872480 RepID=UPI003D06F525
MDRTSFNSKPSQLEGSLSGINVLDFGHYYPGPMAAMMLADQGANVIRVVKPGDLELPSQQYRLLNRNKKLLTLDLKSVEGKAQALSLIERADVVIENFRPCVMHRMGLDYASVKAQGRSRHWIRPFLNAQSGPGPVLPC